MTTLSKHPRRVALVTFALAMLTASCARAPALPPQPNAATPITPAATAMPDTASGLSIPVANADEFPTPEAAITYFVDTVKGNHFYESLKAFAITEHVTKSNYEARAKYLRIYFDPNGLLPQGYTGLNTALALNYASRTYESAVLALLGVDESQMRPLSDQKGDAELATFLDQVDPGKLKDTQIVSIDNVNASMTVADKDRLAATSAKTAELFGAEQSVTYKVVLKRGSQTARCESLIVLKYGKNWKIFSGLFDTLS